MKRTVSFELVSIQYIQARLTGVVNVIWFDRSVASDRGNTMWQMHEAAARADCPPVLIFPEGSICIGLCVATALGIVVLG